MYRRLKIKPVLKTLSGEKPLTRHGSKNIERKAHIALYTALGLGLVACTFFLMYLARYPMLIADLLPTMILATLIPFFFSIYYLLGLLDADAEITRDQSIQAIREAAREINIESKISTSKMIHDIKAVLNKGGNNETKGKRIRRFGRQIRRRRDTLKWSL